MEYITKIIDIRQVTHDVKCFRLEKPSGYSFHPGQATDVSINQPDWKDQLRPFTFTCLNEDPYLEFTIKRYPDHHGVTDRLHQLQPGEELILRDVWGAIQYMCPGYFIAGGAGITPFMAILRQLHKENKAAGNRLFFSNKTSADIIYEEELQTILGANAVFVLTKEGNTAAKEGNTATKEGNTATKEGNATTNEDKKGYLHTRINGDFIKEHVRNFRQPFYICGPDPMILEINGILTGLGASPEALVFEK